MLKTIVLLISFAAVCSASSYASRAETLEAFKYLLSLPQPLARDLASPASASQYEYKFSDCSGGKGVLHVNELSIGPDPIVLPGNVTVKASVALDADLSHPIKASVNISKVIFGTDVKIPCVNGEGSCVYSDVCTLIPKKGCPAVFEKNKIPCHCPFAAGKYNLPATTFAINKKEPSVVNGDYKAKVELTDAKGKMVGCIQAQLSLKLD